MMKQKKTELRLGLFNRWLFVRKATALHAINSEKIQLLPSEGVENYAELGGKEAYSPCRKFREIQLLPSEGVENYAELGGKDGLFAMPLNSDEEDSFFRPKA